MINARVEQRWSRKCFMWCFRRTTIAKRRRWTIQLLEMRTCKQKEAFSNINWKDPNPKIKMRVVFCLSPSVMMRLKQIPQPRQTRTSSGPTVSALERCKHRRAPTTLRSHLDLIGKSRRITAALQNPTSPVFCFVIEKPISLPVCSIMAYNAITDTSISSSQILLYI